MLSTATANTVSVESAMFGTHACLQFMFFGTALSCRAGAVKLPMLTNSLIAALLYGVFYITVYVTCMTLTNKSTFSLQSIVQSSVYFTFTAGCVCLSAYYVFNEMHWIQGTLDNGMFLRSKRFVETPKM